MQMPDALRSFIQAHAGDDLSDLLLSATRYPEVDIPFAVEQIAIRRRIREKLPAWYADDRLLFPSKIAAEQCSSEQTACYKQRLLNSEKHLCDLTGGLGIDTCYFAQKVEQVTYVERSTRCFDVAMHNFSVLCAGNITGYNETAEDVLEKIGSVDVFYLDPARRKDGHARVFALADCEPDLVKLLPVLLCKAPKVIAKLSPMLDIRHTLALLPETAEVHVVSVKNECKELLFVLKREKEMPEPPVYCVNDTASGTEQFFRFRLSDERANVSSLSPSVRTYLYEPNVSILKAGAYKQTALQMGVDKLHASSHLYTSDRLVANFPGRIFRVEEVIPFHGKCCKTIARHIPFANLSVRNFPLSVAELRKRTGIADGGEIYLFATTLADNEKVLIRCRKNQ
ncbi:MAG: SAM-dependent methyltransferase [Tannerella sp.]|jgi:hypothetical protein|nr:SAM-dependent methyltransferase [Tannerella sp.]